MDYLHDDDQGALDLVLGHVHHLLGEDGDVHAQRLVASASLRLWQNGGWYRPDPGDNWTEKTYDATLLVDPVVLGEFTPEVRERIWPKVEAVLIGRGRHDVTALAVERGVRHRRRSHRTGARVPRRARSVSSRATRRATNAPRAATRSATNSCSAASPSARCTTRWSRCSTSARWSGRSPSLRRPG